MAQEAGPAADLYLGGQCIPLKRLLPGVDLATIKGRGLKASLAQKLWIQPKDLTLLLHGWKVLSKDERVQDLYSYYQEVQNPAVSGREIGFFKRRCSGIVLHRDTEQLFYPLQDGRAEETEVADTENIFDYLLERLTITLKVSLTIVED